MKQENEELLLIDLCARLPYNIAIDCRSEDSRFTCYLTTDMLREIQNNTCYWEYKPFLFPLSSMTQEQYENFLLTDSKITLKGVICSTKGFEFLNKHHFDWRGLILKGLAIDATGLNIY